MANVKSVRACLDRSGAVWSILDADLPTLVEILTVLDPDPEREPMPGLWKRGFHVAGRSSFEH